MARACALKLLRRKKVIAHKANNIPAKKLVGEIHDMAGAAYGLRCSPKTVSFVE